MAGGLIECFLRALSSCRPSGSAIPRWFRFDDGDVTEAKMDDEEVHVYVYTCTYMDMYLDTSVIVELPIYQAHSQPPSLGGSICPAHCPTHPRCPTIDDITVQ